MKNQPAMRLQAPTKNKDAKPLSERGRMLFERDVLALLPTKDGRPVKSLWWVRNCFAPDQKHKLGRDSYWWECDVVAFLDRDAA